jgi:hypothetical protein
VAAEEFTTQRNKIDNPDMRIDKRNHGYQGKKFFINDVRDIDIEALKESMGEPMYHSEEDEWHKPSVLEGLQHKAKREAVADHITKYLKGDIIASGSGYERYRIYLALTNAIEHIFDLDFNNN